MQYLSIKEMLIHIIVSMKLHLANVREENSLNMSVVQVNC